jgi:hypothetical protein
MGRRGLFRKRQRFGKVRAGWTEWSVAGKSGHEQLKFGRMSSRRSSQRFRDTKSRGEGEKGQA